MNNIFKFVLASAFFGLFIASAFAQAAVASPVTAPTPSWLDSMFGAGASLWPTIITVASTITAIWKHREASTKQKVAQSLVKVIESATKIPEVQQFEDKIKRLATAEATALGVQDDLHAIVSQITTQA